MRRPISLLLLLCAAVVLLGSGCVRARARTVADAPALAVPPPPPRVVAASEPPPIETSPAPFPTSVPTAPAPPAVSPAPAASRPAAKPAPQEADVKAAEVPEPSVSRTLRPVPVNIDVDQQARVREVLTQASRDLARVNYGRLSTGGQSQYDQSKRFADQAEEALKDGNLLFAQTLAEKAATLAAGLAGR